MEAPSKKNVRKNHCKHSQNIVKCTKGNNILIFKEGRTRMKITEVRIRKVKKDDSKLKAVASITIDDVFVIHDIKVIDGNEGNFIAMPSRKTPDGEYKDIVHPLNTETREMIRNIILTEYDKVKDLAE